MKLGMIGLGRMGANMAERLREADHEVLGFDPHSEDTDVGSLEELVGALDAPRVCWSMVPAGEPTEATVKELIDRLEPDDIVVDGGNSYFGDSIRRALAAEEVGIRYVDAGVSGGIWGRRNGYALMVGGEVDPVSTVWPVLHALAPPPTGEVDDPGAPLATRPGLAHVGPAGCGHFVKMVHNGIEYAQMQALAEGYELMHRYDLDLDIPAALNSWRAGSVVRSWLLDLLVQALDQYPGFEELEGYAADSGEGRWTVSAAVESGTPVPAISAALFARFESQHEFSPGMKAVAALRQQFGGHPVRTAE